MWEWSFLLVARYALLVMFKAEFINRWLRGRTDVRTYGRTDVRTLEIIVLDYAINIASYWSGNETNFHLRLPFITYNSRRVLSRKPEVRVKILCGSNFMQEG